MPLRLEFPVLKTFSIVEYADNGQRKIRRANEGEPADGYVTFRQATIQEAEIRTGMVSKRRYMQDSESYTVFDDINLDGVARAEVMLTLAGTDIQYPERTKDSDEPKYRDLEFYEPTGFPKIKNQNQFNAWWNAMPIDWAQVIHACCMEMNPNWSTKSQ